MVFPTLLIVAGVPAFGGLAAWAVAKLIEPQHMLKLVRAAPSGSAELDRDRQDLARHADKLGMEFDLQHFDKLAATIVREPDSARKQDLKDAKAALRDLAFDRHPAPLTN
ncbi:hypothetical protein [Sphingomonas xinjiangensis]|uniref:Uncharacterized protein n=1 Tax=Sphingomonas xinjiangensis TaxID=643568 RepID=A0A840YRU1_9SPHN|nr:hypothetical protein [Sphingomonas xinjiangensis]MBB5712396.1 hypothetical protein [Sphingomonas xinjiangensis]